VLVAVLHLVTWTGWWLGFQYLAAIAVAGLITLLCSVAFPHALAQHAAEQIIASHVHALHAMRVALLPATKLMYAINYLVARIVGVTENGSAKQAEQEIQQEILSVVEEGAKEGTVDPQEREMIESVIQFRDASVGQVMTPRPEIIGLPIGAALEQVKQVLEESGHSRLPVYDGTVDHIVGVLYARDLLKHLGQPSESFNIRSATRSAFYVPETKPLRDLLRDFRQQKVHLAIVLDEYGGTAGLVTIEDVLEELVGDISDEFEPRMPDTIQRIDEQTFEADALASIDDINQHLHLNLPEDAGYETLGGFVSNMLGRIPKAGARFEQPGARFIVLDAEPQRVKRLKIELVPQPAAAPTPAAN
jgi:putative hemolysin